MHQIDSSKTFVLSLGGSLIIPPEGFDIAFLSAFSQFIRTKVAQGKRFLISCGGGATARDYINAASGVIGESLKDVDKDWLGIHSSRLNGHLMRTIFRDIAYRRMLDEYDVIDKKAKEFPIVIGAGWKPGWSTDYCTVMLAENYHASTVINLSNIDKIYDKDPKKFSDAKPIDLTTWDQVIAIGDELLEGKKWIPGLNSPFDPIASRKGKELDLKVIIANGKKLENLGNIIDGRPFTGTVIENG